MTLDLFEKIDVRETPDLTNGVPVNVNSRFTGAGAQSEYFYVVPDGKKFVAYSIYHTESNAGDANNGMNAYNASSDVMFTIPYTFATNTDFLGGVPVIFEAGSSFYHFYLGAGAGSYASFSLMGVEIDER